VYKIISHLFLFLDKLQKKCRPLQFKLETFLLSNCNQCLQEIIYSFVHVTLRQLQRLTTLSDVCQWLAAGRWFSPGPPISSTNKSDCHDITEIESGVKYHQAKQTTTTETTSNTICNVHVWYMYYILFIYLRMNKLYLIPSTAHLFCNMLF